jgi:hypothetical protein
MNQGIQVRKNGFFSTISGFPTLQRSAFQVFGGETAPIQLRPKPGDYNAPPFPFEHFLDMMHIGGQK